MRRSEAFEMWLILSAIAAAAIAAICWVEGRL